MKIERRFTANAASPVKLQKRAESDPPMIVGTASVTYDGTPNTEYELWRYGNERAVERIMPGAFDGALSRPDDCRGLFNHNPDLLLGRTAAGTMKLSVDAKGLNYEITPGNTTVSKDVSEHLGRGDVTGSSFAFAVDEESWIESKDADGNVSVTREIRSVTLYDVGPVTYPAYEATKAGMRADGDVDEAKAALAAHRAKQKPSPSPPAEAPPAVELVSRGINPISIKGKLAGYAARARAASLAD